jgi:hypothetical protein
MRMGKYILVWTIILWSLLWWVHPAAASDTVIFTANGDMGHQSGDPFNGMLQGVKASGSQFHLALGDLSYEASNEQAWAEHIKGVLGGDFPFELVSGNHDSGESCCGEIEIYAQHLPHQIDNISPNADYGKEYYFDYPSAANPIVRVIMISPDLFGWDYDKGSDHYEWVKSAILEAREQSVAGHPIPWIVVGMHKNCITMGTKSCEVGGDIMDLMFGDGLGEGGGPGDGVDLVLQGHDHIYNRSGQIQVNSDTCTSIPVGSFNADCITVAGSAFEQGMGGILNINGLGGKSLYDINTGDSEAGYFEAWSGGNIDASYGFTKVTATKTQFAAEFVATEGSFTDSFTITREDAGGGGGGGDCLMKAQGDANCDDSISLVDFGVWRANYIEASDTTLDADFNGDGAVTLIDFSIWRNSYITG